MMKIYFEIRKLAGTGNTEGVASDIMRHLYTRQYLGKTVVVCQQPIAMLSAARKQWLKLSRSLQRQRSSTLNADKILKFTHGIAHMQRLRFGSKLPLEQPQTDVFFLKPDELHTLPAQCLTLYVTCSMADDLTSNAVGQLPPDSIIVDYTPGHQWETLHLAPKKQLETHVAEEWKQVKHFLSEYGINISALHKNEVHNVEAMDVALDILLNVSHRFLTVASSFQRTMELARPMRMHKTLREKYDSFILLAHRVQALTPGAFSQQFLQIYNEDDTFFLYDHSQEFLLLYGETFEESHLRHTRAGRKNLAQALAQFYTGRSFQPIK